MARVAITALLATGTALVPPTTRIASHKLRAVDEATALLEQAAALRAEADALAADAAPPAPAPAPPAPVAVAEPVVEAKELSPEEKTQREIENRAKITEALRAATKARNKEQIQIALATAEKAGGFSRDNLDIIAAVQAFNELNELSDEVRNKLVADMRKSDPMSAAVWKSNLRRVRAESSSTPSTRHLLDGVAMSVPHRSTEPTRPHSTHWLISTQVSGLPGRRQPVHRHLCSDDRARHRGRQRNLLLICNN